MKLPYSAQLKGSMEVRIQTLSVEVFIVRDFITYKKETLQKGLTDDHGNFKLSFHHTDTHIAILKLGRVERTLFIEPGKSYYIPVEASLKKLHASKGFFAKGFSKSHDKTPLMVN